jgi:S1-C subfamily serine protease
MAEGFSLPVFAYSIMTVFTFAVNPALMAKGLVARNDEVAAISPSTAAPVDAPVKADAQLPTPISASGRTGMLPIKFDRFVTTLEDGVTLGPRKIGMFCSNNGTIKWNDKTFRDHQSRFRVQANKEMESAGYLVAKPRAQVFAVGNQTAEAALELGALLTKMKVDLCFSFSGQVRGSIAYSVTWALFDPRTQKVLVEISTESSYRTASEFLQIDDLEDRAVSAAVRSLLANEKFIQGLVAAPGPEPPAAAKSAFVIPKVLPMAGGTTKNSTELGAAVVTVQTASGSGSGFYISRDGHLLTNHHVVKDNSFVSIRTATGRELPGEVLAVDSRRDVAIIKTRGVPYSPLALRLEIPKVGEEVFAIGSPLSEQFAGTITRGILGGIRELDNFRYLQSDVSVTNGNSGGPLLDRNGAVIGITKGGLVVKGGNMNFFIPIVDALASLSIEMK